MAGFKFKPEGDVLKAFMRSNRFFRGIRGPVGSGKSVANCVEIYRRASEQAPSTKDGVRKTRWAVVRNTNPQLRTTTIKTWLAWFTERDFGAFKWSVPYTHHIRHGDIDCEVIFLALDREDDVKKLLSLDLTGVFINEAREVPKTIVDACTMRVGRYPPMAEGGPTWYGVMADTNAPEDDHWWPVMAGESPVPDYLPEEEKLMLIKPEDWEFFTQPAGMIEERDANGRVVGYKTNPQAENYRNLPGDYYPRIITGKRKSWIDVYVMNRLGVLEDGKPVYPTYVPETHKASTELTHVPGATVWVGVDFGLTPAAVFGQCIDGQWQIFHEIVTQDMGATRFGELFAREVAKHCEPMPDIRIYGDPTGDYRGNDEQRAFTLFTNSSGYPVYPAPGNNDPLLRIEAVESLLNKMANGQPALSVCPTCKVINKGFASGYQYRRYKTSGEARFEEKPDKNKYSHPHDALQYLCLGAGIGKKIIQTKNQGKVVNARGDANLWNRIRKKRSRQAHGRL